MRRAWALAAVCAWTVSIAGPGPRKSRTTSDATVIAIAWQGAAVPIACASGGKVTDASACASLLRGKPTLRTTHGRMQALGWDPGQGLCPWGDVASEVGAFRICADCDLDEKPAELAIVPYASHLRMSAGTAVPASDAQLAEQLDAIAHALAIDRAQLELRAAIAIELDGKAPLDRVITVAEPRKKPHPLDLEDPQWTFVFIAGRAPVSLARAGCTGAGPELVGAIDVDGDGALELVIRLQYQFVIYRLDGSVLFESAACCGLG
jgi:hypothetical protein